MNKIILFLATVFLFIACNDTRNESTVSTTGNADSAKVESREERNKKTVMAAMAALNAHNADDLVSTMAPDAVDYGDGLEEPIKNLDTVKTMMGDFMKAFPDFKSDNLMYFADGDHVVVIGDWSGTFKNDLGKMKATGKSFKFKDADIFKLNDEGKIVEHRFIQPNATIFKQIGVKTK
jgi:predicted ester cyclase